MRVHVNFLGKLIGLVVAIAVPYEFEIQIWLRDGMKGLGNKTRIGKFEKLHGFTYVITVSALL